MNALLPVMVLWLVVAVAIPLVWPLWSG